MILHVGKSSKWAEASPRETKRNWSQATSSQELEAPSSLGTTRFTGPRSKSITSRDCSMCKGLAAPDASTRFQSKSLNVQSLACWISATKSPAPSAWTVPEGMKMQSPAWGLIACKQSWVLPIRMASAKSLRVTPDWSPAYRTESGSVSMMYQASVFPKSGVLICNP